MSLKPKKKILVVSLSIVLILAFALGYVNFFKPQSSVSTTKVKPTKALKTKKDSSTTNSSTSTTANETNTSKTISSKPEKNTTPSQNLSSTVKQTVLPKPAPAQSSKPSNSVISDSNIRTLLYNGDIAVRNFYSSAYFKNSNTKNPINLDNKTYSEMVPAITSYNILQDFMRKNYNLNSYYTETFIRKFMDETFRYINGKYYILVGNYGLMLHYSNTFKVVSKVSNGNILYLKISDYADGDTSPSVMNVALYYSGKNWLIYKFDDWGIASLAN
ncbi:hypothetical protein AGR56_17915 [Clostridium sp. DMHC 10]|uniref:DL-endopeptidase inhibitor IseA family protein n=1 Tax=Clostridium sp. DMHC 10 TaxID=747377 RepID=UPI00069FC576|nr:DL-endopeptidase inhibitor IseA family protein [Clostridium sp. DMHC 10]KOF55710.1 hypothetical protein AGR56_17915 [Clostridium sp. DMHC 10]